MPSEHRDHILREGPFSYLAVEAVSTRQLLFPRSPVRNPFQGSSDPSLHAQIRVLLRDCPLSRKPNQVSPRVRHFEAYALSVRSPNRRAGLDRLASTPCQSWLGSPRDAKREFFLARQRCHRSVAPTMSLGDSSRLLVSWHIVLGPALLSNASAALSSLWTYLANCRVGGIVAALVQSLSHW